LTVTIINGDLITSGPLTPKKKEKLGVLSALSVAETRPKKLSGEIVFPLHNNMDNKPGRILEVLKVIDMELKLGHKPFLIHCEHGHDRSPTIAALYLYYSRNSPSFRSALKFVESKNPKVKPKKEFVKFIDKEVAPIIRKNLSKSEKKKKRRRMSKQGQSKKGEPIADQQQQMLQLLAS
jgi:Dual specificity phosphatase, catalytic domain